VVRASELYEPYSLLRQVRIGRAVYNYYNLDRF
jgi:hypothetical protein